MITLARSMGKAAPDPASDHRFSLSKSASGASVEVFSIPMLIASINSLRSDAERQIEFRSISCSDAIRLIPRLELTTDPITLWAIHLRLAALGVPPCQRWPPNVSDPQSDYIAALADLNWAHRQLPPDHRAPFRGWRALLAQERGSNAWHAHAHRQLLWASRRRALGHWMANGLGLSEPLRADLLLAPTYAMQTDRRRLHWRAMREAEETLLTHARAHPDKAGIVSPEQRAARHLRIWRCFILAGRSSTKAAIHWTTLTGERLSRQRIASIAGKVDEVITSRQRRTRKHD